MLVGFRVDANENIASGHMVRCMTIAKELNKLGCDCIFYLAEDKETWRLAENGFQFKILNSKWNDLNSEKEMLSKIIVDGRLDWLVVDSYQADNEYLAYLNGFCKVAYMDDMAIERYDISAVVHYGLQDAKYIKMYEGTDTLCFAGPEFIPLREEFSVITDIKREKSVMITTGGTDVYNVTLEFLKHFVQSEVFEDYSVYAIVGSMNTYEMDIRAFANENSRITVLKNISNMSHYMRKCEFAVSAGGTTLYELCACNTPTVCFSFADNQSEFAKRMEIDGLMLCAGDPRFDGEMGSLIVERLEKLKNGADLREKCVENMRKLVDGKGAWRIAKQLIENDK